MIRMKKEYPGVLITPKFGWKDRISSFLRGEAEIHTYSGKPVWNGFEGLDL